MTSRLIGSSPSTLVSTCTSGLKSSNSNARPPSGSRQSRPAHRSQPPVLTHPSRRQRGRPLLRPLFLCLPRDSMLRGALLLWPRPRKWEQWRETFLFPVVVGGGQAVLEMLGSPPLLPLLHIQAALLANGPPSTCSQ